MRASEGFAAKQSLWRRLAIQSSPEDTSEKELIHRSTLIIISTFTVLAGLIWGGMYVALGEYLAALCPAIYSCLMGLTLAICICHNNQFGYGIFAKCQLTLILVLPFAVHVALGGVQESGCVMLWSFLCPMGSAFFRSAKEAVRWFYVYLSLSLALLAMDFQEQSSKHSDNDAIRESKIESLYFTMNILGVMSVVFCAVFLFARDLEHEYAQSEKVLTNIMPKPIVIRIKRGEFPIVDHLSEVCILFADLVGFTKASAEHHPNFLIGLFLRDVFLEFDRCVEKHGLEKIKTIGKRGILLLRLQKMSSPPNLRKYNLKFTLRAGVNVGPVVAGVLGLKRFTYDVWGDSVNTASRMESNGLPGHVHLSSQMYEMVKHLSDVFEFSCRGNIQIKRQRGKKVIDFNEVSRKLKIKGCHKLGQEIQAICLLRQLPEGVAHPSRSRWHADAKMDVCTDEPQPDVAAADEPEQGNRRHHIIARRIVVRFLPNSYIRLFWDAFIFLVIWYNAVLTPVRIFISRDRTPKVLVSLDVLFDFIFVFDTLLRFYRPYVDENTGGVVTDPLLIRRKYQRSAAFYVNVIACVPILKLPISPFLDGVQLTTLLTYFNVLRMIRVLHLPEQFFELKRFLERNGPINEPVYRMHIIFFFMVLFICECG
ncbi:hypothetical protein THAOC_06887, partial [Thalassiosira oceanica]